MSETANSNPTAVEAQTPGAMLRAMREAQGLSHANVSEALRLTVHYIKAVENDEYGKLPGLTFVKGYLRSYANFLKADVDSVMRVYERHLASITEEDNRTEQVQRTRRRNDQAMRWAVTATLIVVAGVAGGWWFLGQREEVQPPRYITQPQTQPAVTAAVTARTPTPNDSTAAARALPAGAVPVSPVNGSVATQPAAADMAVSAAPAGLAVSINAQGATTTLLPGTTTADTAQAPVVASEGAAATMLPAGASAAPGTTTAVAAEAAATAAPEQMPAASSSGDSLTVTPTAEGTRQVSLVSTGNDVLQLSFTGNSWVEIDDGANTRLYNDMLLTGDVLMLRGTAPFHLLFGDGNNVQVTFNSSAIDIASQIRSDRTARVVVPATAASAAPTAASSPASTTSAAAAPATGVTP